MLDIHAPILACKVEPLLLIWAPVVIIVLDEHVWNPKIEMFQKARMELSLKSSMSLAKIEVY